MDVQLFSAGTGGKSRPVSSQMRINAYLEFQPPGDRSELAIYQTPGTVLVHGFGTQTIRGTYSIEDTGFVAHSATLWLFNPALALTPTSIGTFATSVGDVFFTASNASIFMTDGINGYVYARRPFDPIVVSGITHTATLAKVVTLDQHNLSTGMSVTVAGVTPVEYNGTWTINVIDDNEFEYTMLSTPGASGTGGTVVANRFSKVDSEGFPNFPTPPTWMDGYFVVGDADSNRFYISEDGYYWDALDFSSAESNPDNIVRPFSDTGLLYLFSSTTIEFWNDTGAQDFPFQQVSGGAIEYGLGAVRGVCKYNNSLAALVRNRLGNAQVAVIQGSRVDVVSTPEIEDLINVAAGITRDAVLFAYELSGHAMLQCNFPSLGYSLLYDGLSNAWSTLKSVNYTAHLSRLGTNFQEAFYVTDIKNGNLYRLDGFVYTDNNRPIVMTVVSRHLAQDNDRLTVDQIQLDIETGVGVDAAALPPQIMMDVSKDGGRTYGVEQWTSLGAIGDYTKRAQWTRQGAARDWTFRFSISENVKKVIYGGSMRTRGART